MKTVLITGANKSIGFETAMVMAEKGYYVFVESRDLEDGKMAAEKIRNVGYDRVEATRIDITNPNSVAEARQEIERKSGRLDILINNAGISGSKASAAFQCTGQGDPKGLRHELFWYHPYYSDFF